MTEYLVEIAGGVTEEEYDKGMFIYWDFILSYSNKRKAIDGAIEILKSALGGGGVRVVEISSEDNPNPKDIFVKFK